MSTPEHFTAEPLECLMDARDNCAPLPLGKQACVRSELCSFELSSGLFGEVSSYGGCQRRIEARRAHANEEPSLGGVLTRLVIDIEPRVQA